MKSTLFAIAIAIVVLFTGCLVTKVPVVTTNPDGSRSTNNVYVPNESADKVKQAVEVVAPMLPPPWNMILTGVGGLFTGGLATYLTIKNQKKR